MSHNGWTLSVADAVFAVEGASAVLPCTFTHPPAVRPLTGSVLWYKMPPWPPSLVLNCTFPGPGRPRCGEVTQEAGGDRFRFVGNFREGDASIMMEQLRQEDSDQYRCRLELSVGGFQSVIPTQLTVKAPGGNVSVVTGTERGSATLPCVFPLPATDHVPLTVTWMRKDPYRHIVTFRPQAGGPWAAENGATRLELVGNPERGNATTRIKPLMVEDSHGYLCLVEVRKPDNYKPTVNVDAKLMSSVHPPYIEQYQRELRLLVTPVSSTQLVKYIVPIVILLLILCILLIILWKKGVFSPSVGSATCSKRGGTSPDATGQGEQPQCDPESVGTVVSNTSEAESAGNVVSNTSEADQAESCTYASIVIGGGKAKKPQADDKGGPKPEAANSEVIYATVVTSR